jgi:hypothetical protein
MAQLPEDKSGYYEGNQPLNLTDISYNHRVNNLRMSEQEYQNTFGKPFTCSMCKKHAYSGVEGGTDSPECDSCWSTLEDAGVGHSSYPKPDKPIFSDKPHEFWNESNYRSKDYGLHYCGQTNDMTGKPCDYVAESRWGLEDHWDHDPEHNGGKEK